MRQPKVKKITATIWNDGESKHFEVKGKPARTLCELVKAAGRGVTALELSNTWALRLSAYIHDLRHKYGVKIITHREPHDGGTHGRYVLISPVDITDIQYK
tara:strand:- start:328 stop:630 length:303 start_codon:yes stop_codon:yes gene_type:complete